MASWFRAPTKSSDAQHSSHLKPISSPPSPVSQSAERLSAEPLRKSVSLSIPREIPPIESRAKDTARDNNVATPSPAQPERGRPSKDIFTTTPQAQAKRSTSAIPTTPTPFNGSTDTLPELLQDPFSGAPLGFLVPDRNETALADPSITGKDQDLLNHLGRILELQSDIATMHVQMEGIGARAKAKTRTMDKKASQAVTQHRNHADHGGAAGDDPGIGDRTVEDEGDEVADDEEAVGKKAREEEFARLGDRFMGRKDAIDEIMNKLDDLSQALTTFHTLQTPSIEFTHSRFNSTSKSSVPQPIQHSRTLPPLSQHQVSASKGSNSLPSPTPATSTPSSSSKPTKLKHHDQNEHIVNAWVRDPKDLPVDSPISIKEDPMNAAP